MIMLKMRSRIVRDDNKISKYPIVGDVKVGKKVESGDKIYPTSLDYFICKSQYATLFKKAYGDKPNTIQVVFISDDFSESCNERYECRDNKGNLVGYGDGELSYIYNTNTCLYELEKDRIKIKQAGKWYAVLSLKFVIPKIKGIFGLFRYSTKGVKSSLPQIRDAFDLVYNNVGTVINIPFDLTVKKVMSQKPGSDWKFPVVNLIPNISEDNMIMLKSYLSQGNDIKSMGFLDQNKIKMIENAKVD